MSDWSQPKPTIGMDVAFGPRNMKEFLPAEEEIPEEFWRYPGTKWNQLTSTWFFEGLKGQFVPKPGIDLKAALGHLKTIMVSFDPKHEHKEAGVSYLMSLWFEDFKAEAVESSHGR